MKCKHTNKVWKGEYQYCLRCNRLLNYKDMNYNAKLPNIKLKEFFNDN